MPSQPTPSHPSIPASAPEDPALTQPPSTSAAPATAAPALRPIRGSNGSGPSSPVQPRAAAAAAAAATAARENGGPGLHEHAQQEAHALATLATTHDFMQQVGGRGRGVEEGWWKEGTGEGWKKAGGKGNVGSEVCLPVFFVYVCCVVVKLVFLGAHATWQVSDSWTCAVLLLMVDVRVPSLRAHPPQAPT